MTMQTITTATVVASSQDDEDRWHEVRGTGVTASRIHAIANGSKRTWRRLLDDDLNGSTFKGNRHTRRGHEREPFLIAYVEDVLGEEIRAAGELFAAAANPRHMATPDGVGSSYGVEAKSHIFGSDLGKIPAEHYDQMQWGMHVLGFTKWVYVREVMGEDGEPTLNDPLMRWVDRDEKRIAVLVEAADAYLAWRDAGAPDEDDDLPDDFEDVVTPWLAAVARRDAAVAAAKALEGRVRALISRRDDAEERGWKPTSTVGGFTYSVTTKQVLDEDAWKTAEPDGYAEVVELRKRLAETEAAAAALYTKTTATRRLLPVQPKGEDQ
ncbi:YqaJ viral recombinase family protein [Microbacterium oryzae]|uniref:YqaJ viral recombinase family protein n=1 Tax=Microbacterium oryzae TaxID=743009 RepID=UPI0025B1258E|nr:YqaJ viral recombinase family protein [Microbacterium oryzae]MDN3309590.1 YqaJ viral recombinase family protein [Microbacterium oryzae]